MMDLLTGRILLEQTLQNYGPIDMFVPFQEKMVNFLYSATVTKPLNLQFKTVDVELLMKTDKIESIFHSQLHTDKIQIEHKGLLYPLGLFLKIKLEGCHDKIYRFY